MDNTKYYWEDTIHYYTAAENIISQGDFGIDPERIEKELPFSIEPVYSIFLVPFAYFANGNFLWIRIVQEFLYVLSSLMMFLMLLVLVNRNFALFGTFIYLFYPFYIYFGGVVLTEGIYTPILFSYVYASFVYLKNDDIKYFYLSIFILAILGHIKVQSWSLGLSSMLLFLFMNWKINLKFIGRSVLATSIFLLVCLPWGIRNYELNDKISLPRSYGVEQQESEMEYRFNERSSILQNSINYFSPALTGVDSKNKFTSSSYNIISILSTSPLLLATLLIPFFFWRNKYMNFLYLTFICYALPYLVLFARTRFRIPVDFIMIIFFASLIFIVIEKYFSLKVSK
ncbi:MAG: glycosyltransferase family 39 protein [Bacteroidetes bacterium]|nr:glycosyltransferase family 39 protein [Bacteroidota bacterium]